MDSGSMVGLVHNSYSNHYSRPKLGHTKGTEGVGYNIFEFKGNNECGIPWPQYFKMDIKFLG